MFLVGQEKEFLFLSLYTDSWILIRLVTPTDVIGAGLVMQSRHIVCRTQEFHRGKQSPVHLFLSDQKELPSTAIKWEDLLKKNPLPHYQVSGKRTMFMMIQVKRMNALWELTPQVGFLSADDLGICLISALENEPPFLIYFWNLRCLLCSFLCFM